MDRPLFSEMLYDRRRQLGLSIKQASNVLRLKEEVLIAFEEGDFESIPKSGYAQGMLSSYARYLGLNAKTVVNQFSTDLFEHERGAGSHEARRRSRHNRNSDDGPLYETPQAAAMGQTSRRTYVESHGFLPTSGALPVTWVTLRRLRVHGQDTRVRPRREVTRALIPTRRVGPTLRVFPCLRQPLRRLVNRSGNVPPRMLNQTNTVLREPTELRRTPDAMM